MICRSDPGGGGPYLEKTRMGKAIRAVADNRGPRQSTGIDVEQVITFVWISGAGLAAISGVFFGLDPFNWDFGFRILLLVRGRDAWRHSVGLRRVRRRDRGRPDHQHVAPLHRRRVQEQAALLFMSLILLFRPRAFLVAASGRVGGSSDGLGIRLERTFSPAAFGIEAMVFALAAIGLNIHVGYTGLLNFGHIAFMAAGAYGLGMTVYWMSIQ